jgi:hypothetical protein
MFVFNQICPDSLRNQVFGFNNLGNYYQMWIFNEYFLNQHIVYQKPTLSLSPKELFTSVRYEVYSYYYAGVSPEEALGQNLSFWNLWDSILSSSAYSA